MVEFLEGKKSVFGAVLVEEKTFECLRAGI